VVDYYRKQALVPKDVYHRLVSVQEELDFVVEQVKFRMEVKQQDLAWLQEDMLVGEERKPDTQAVDLLQQDKQAVAVYLWCILQLVCVIHRYLPKQLWR
jgi:hypothetical protein